LVLGCFALLRWQLDPPLLRSIQPGPAAMGPLTAVTFMLVASALWLETGSLEGHRRMRWLARAAASLVLLVGLVTVVGSSANVIAADTGLCLALLGAALLLLDWESRPRLWPAQFMALISAAISLTSLLGHAYGAEAQDNLARYNPMALPTAATCLVLSVGTLWARPGRGLIAAVTADDPGGVLARRLLPIAVLTPAVIGWLRLVAEHRGLLSLEIGLAIMVVVSILLFTALIVTTCRSLNRADLIRKASERRLVTQYATTAILTRAPTLAEAFPQVLEAISKSLDWSLAIHWSVDADHHVLQCAETWMAPFRAGQALADQSRRMTFARGVGLPGRIWSSEQSAWIVDVARDSNFPRAPSAAIDGLHGAFGFPLVGPGGFLGVMEFFSPEIREPDDALLQMFDAVGRQIGQFIERETAQAALERARQAAEAGRLLQAQENESRRIARELHDDLGQGLALLTVKMDLLRQSPPEETGELEARMQELLAQIRHLSSSVHDLSHQLHPSKLEQLGLVAAIGGLCRELTHSHGLKIEFTHDELPAVSPDTAVCLYRIAQEGLQNAIKHSGARQAEVVLRWAADVISLWIVDHGRGFDPRQVQGKSGLGLVSMRERVRYLGGEIAIDSQPSGGTRLHVRVPRKDTEHLA
jgi:signal transduction histidine kinase